MERFSTPLKGKELSQISIISSEVKFQESKEELYPILYPKKKETALTISL